MFVVARLNLMVSARISNGNTHQAILEMNFFYFHRFRKVKWDQRKLAEQGNALVDLAKLQNDMHTMIWTMQQTLDHLSAQMAILTQNFNQLQEIGVGVINRDESLKQMHVKQEI